MHRTSILASALCLASTVTLSACVMADIDDQGFHLEAEQSELRAQTSGDVSIAATTQATGWLWYDGSGAPAAYQYNSSGGTNTVGAGGIGVYFVRFPGLGGQGGHFQVSAYGGDGKRCKIMSWGLDAGGQDITAEIRCLDTTGYRADGEFLVLYRRHGVWEDSAQGAAAYLLADSPTSSSYTPVLAQQYNSTGGTNTMTRAGTGAYTARLAGMSDTGGTVLVTAYGGDAEHCKVGGWYVSGSDTLVNVYCFDNAGNPVDARFYLSYAIDTALGGAGSANGSQEGAYVWGGGTMSLFPSTYRWTWYTNPAGDMSLERLSTGRYRVSLEHFDPVNYTTALATAYGSDSNYCNVEYWTTSAVYGAPSTDVYVTCFDMAGNPAESYFTLSFQGDMWPLI